MTTQYIVEEILRRNIASLELELQRQRERAEAAEAELKAARGQGPVCFVSDGWFPTRGGAVVVSVFRDNYFKNPLYAAPTPKERSDSIPIPTPAPAVNDGQRHYPEEWGPSDNRRLTCSCGNPDPNHLQSTQASPAPCCNPPEKIHD